MAPEKRKIDNSPAPTRSTGRLHSNHYRIDAAQPSSSRPRESPHFHSLYARAAEYLEFVISGDSRNEHDPDNREDSDAVKPDSDQDITQDVNYQKPSPGLDSDASDDLTGGPIETADDIDKELTNFVMRNPESEQFIFRRRRNLKVSRGQIADTAKPACAIEMLANDVPEIVFLPTRWCPSPFSKFPSFPGSRPPSIPAEALY